MVPTLALVGVLALLGLWVEGSLGVEHHATGHSGGIALTCGESVGQQGRNGEVVVGGVVGLVLPGSGSAAPLTPFLGPGGKKYYVYKMFLAVSSSDAPYATVSIISPASAKLYYGHPLGLNQSLVLASKRSVRLPACGPRFSGYPGGVVLTAPSRVTFSVTAPGRTAARIVASIGAG